MLQLESDCQECLCQWTIWSLCWLVPQAQKNRCFLSLETWKSQQTQCSLQVTGYENPILFESTLTNGKIALKYTILFLFMDVGLTRLFHCKNMHKVVYFNPILSRAPKQYLEMTKYMCICDKISLYFSLYYSTIQDSLNC